MHPALLIGFAVAAGVVTSSYAQLYIDAGGARNVFFGDGANNDLGLSGLHLQLDTGSKSVSGNYFVSPSSGTAPDTRGQDFMESSLLGFDLKFTAIDGLDQFQFKHWPQTDFSAIWNYTWGKIEMEARTVNQWSISPRVTGIYGEQVLFDPNRTTEQFHKRDFFGGTIVATLSHLLPSGSWGNWGLAVTAGFTHTNTYAELQKVTVGKGLGGSGSQTVVGAGQTARLGSVSEYSAFPVSGLFSIVPEFPALNHFLRSDWPLNPFDKKSTYAIVFAPYGSVLLRDVGRLPHAAGVNFVLRSLTDVTKDDQGVPEYNKQKLNFPLTLYVERKNLFYGKPDTTFGAAVMYRFP